MQIFMIGEAAAHKEELRKYLKSQEQVIIELPAEAAWSSGWDGDIKAEDVVITLNYRRSGRGPKFRLLHVPGAGLDGIDVTSLPKECLLCNVYEHQIPIAEYVVHVLLEWQIDLIGMSAFEPDKWSDIYERRKFHGELHGKTVGIVGYGGIGHEIAKRLNAFGVRVIGFDKYARDVNGLDQLCEEIDTLVSESDFVVLACPLTEETRGILNGATISKMKPDAVLVNVSRGPLVDQKALYEALEQKKIGGAVLDVWWNYPRDGKRPSPSDLPFERFSNVIRTPHSCAWTRELFTRRYRVIAENIDALLAGNDEKLKNIVHY